ncbi:electron transport complex protein RnfG [Ruminococcus sp. YE71]|uniref:FMN-binding protein n=1 Tax=unclassified Ruminococcus TaxID=2608920 RepID=UPI00088B143D|nr:MULTISPECIES: FMN-binding protein [unclassified Ruminococcus]SDA09686.1 electron transport complex protein RnfG [Ruminococcus sp. YE78]SFW11634.1 electron transport complex protein RnfG [Ruminococcus sp. YE71]
MNSTENTQSLKELILPPVVLTVICIVVSALLVIAHDATYVDTTGVMTDKLTAGCREIFGEGDYTMLTETEEGKTLPVTFGEEGVDSVITDSGRELCLIELTHDGYATGGLHILVGFDSEGTVAGIAFISIGETPGLGTKVQGEDFLSQFKGFKAGDSTDGIDGVTAATYSSKGMKAAVAQAADIYAEHREEIFGGK